MTNNYLHTLFTSLQDQLEANLQADQKALKHPVAKGDASEANWLNILTEHLPKRYQASKAFVVDSNGCQSEQIDVVIYDWQYTPVLYNKNNQRIIPAESVYAVFEVKPTINKEYITYAGEKISSVRRLTRTSAGITYAAGNYKPRKLFPIIGGVLAYKSDWNPPLGSGFLNALKTLDTISMIDMGCIATEGAFETKYSKRKIEITRSVSQFSLAAFLFQLFSRLQSLGTVPAINYQSYSKSIKHFQ